MVKLKGPGLSQGASGRFADVLTFAKVKNGSYVKRKVIPVDPKSGLQIGHRAMIAFLAQFWSSMSQSEKDSWKARAALTQIGAYHAYMALNSARWGNFESPLKQDLPPSTGTPPSTPASTAVGGVGIIFYSAYCGIYPNLWGHTLSISTNPVITPSKHLTVKVWPGTSAVWSPTTITPIEPGTYYCRSKSFSIHGLFGGQSGRRTAIVT